MGGAASGCHGLECWRWEPCVLMKPGRWRVKGGENGRWPAVMCACAHTVPMSQPSCALHHVCCICTSEERACTAPVLGAQDHCMAWQVAGGGPRRGSRKSAHC